MLERNLNSYLLDAPTVKLVCKTENSSSSEGVVIRAYAKVPKSMGKALSAAKVATVKKFVGLVLRGLEIPVRGKRIHWPAAILRGTLTRIFSVVTEWQNQVEQTPPAFIRAGLKCRPSGAVTSM